MCGEKLTQALSRAYQLGSPPRVRGKAYVTYSPLLSTRITPACAGKSDKALDHRRLIGDHPRVCGEKISHFQRQRTKWGSPPRVRGKVGIILLSIATLRITPACAGKRSTGAEAQVDHRDHPRVCGEKSRSVCAFLRALGSPPRVRGKAFSDNCACPAIRITPACAGKSIKTRCFRIND